MSNPELPSPRVAQSYNYSIRTLGPKAPPAPLRFSYLTLAAAVAVALFLVSGLLLLPLTGFQYDEVMFVYELWHPEAAIATVGTHHHVLPSMMMSYLGALKSWLYLPIFSVFGYSVYAVRLPMLLLAAITILLSGKLLRRIQGKTAANVMIVLLSTDVVFLVTAVFDWGPVVLQNLLLVSGLLCALKWYASKLDRYAFLAGLAYGLALWNKALFLWNFSGILVASLLFALPVFVRLWRWKAAVLLALGLIIGSLPLLKFNLETSGNTLKGNAHFALSAIGDKAWYFSRAINGRAAPPVNSDPASHPGPTPSSWRFPAGLLTIAFGLSIAGGLQRRWIAFFLVSGLIGWLQSALTLDAGGSSHHTVLFWINWYAAVALSVGCIADWRAPVSRKLVAAGISALAILGVLTIAVEYRDLLRHSSTAAWTDADAALAAKLAALGAHHVVTTDWGIANAVALRSQNRLTVAEEVFNLLGHNFDLNEFRHCKAPDCYLVTHVPPKLMLPKASVNLEVSFKDNGLAEGPETVISDTHGTPTFRIVPIVAGEQNETDATAVPPTPAVSSKPSLLATPAVIFTRGEIGRTTLTWNVPADMLVEVHVNAPDGTLFASAKGPGQDQTGFWVKNGTQFFLQNVSEGKARTAENTVARVTVEVHGQ
jgi:hypothetical protein